MEIRQRIRSERRRWQQAEKRKAWMEEDANGCEQQKCSIGRRQHTIENKVTEYATARWLVFPKISEVNRTASSCYKCSTRGSQLSYLILSCRSADVRIWFAHVLCQSTHVFALRVFARGVNLHSKKTGNKLTVLKAGFILLSSSLPFDIKYVCKRWKSATVRSA